MIVGPHIFECLIAFASAESTQRLCPDLSEDGVNLL